MNILISNASDKPIYDQIYNQIKTAILSGQLAPGQALPSIRALAKDLRVSVITTKRAYEELEREGLIYTVAGKGCFAARQDADRRQAEALLQIEELLARVRAAAGPIGLTEEEVLRMYRVTGEAER